MSTRSDADAAFANGYARALEDAARVCDEMGASMGCKHAALKIRALAAPAAPVHVPQPGPRDIGNGVIVGGVLAAPAAAPDRRGFEPPATQRPRAEAVAEMRALADEISTAAAPAPAPHPLTMPFDFSEADNGVVHIKWHGSNTPVVADSYAEMRDRMVVSVERIDRLLANRDTAAAPAACGKCIHHDFPEDAPTLCMLDTGHDTGEHPTECKAVR